KPPPASMPSVEETVSWKDLIGDEPAAEEKPVEKPSSSPSPLPVAPMGFGLGGYGTGFGGVGGLGFPPAQGGFGISGLSADKLGETVPSEKKNAEQKIEK